VINLAQFQKTYFEECAELLAETEERLLALSGDGDETEDLHALFRAVHSIKGGAGAFGFDQLVAYAHTFETLLDAMRDGKVAVSRDVASVLLRAKDVLAHLVGAAQAGQELAADYGQDVSAEMRALTPGGDSDDAGPAAETPASDAAPHEAAEARPRRYIITFKPHASMLRNANEPLLLARELASLGTFTAQPNLDRLPPLSQLEPTDAYLSWTFDLVAECDLDRVREVFEFVEDDCELDIQVSEASGPTAGIDDEAGTDPAAEADLGRRAEDIGAPKRRAADFDHPGRRATDATVAAPTTSAATTIRVDVDKVDALVNMVGEIVITQAMLMQQVGQLPADQYPDLINGVEELSLHTRELQESVMAVRAQPVKSVFARMVRLVHDVAPKLGKDIRLQLSGENTEVDKTVIEQLADPLTHMIRNSIDHGIETPDLREAAGKPRQGTIHLSAGQRSGRIVIEIVDDGAGINRPRVREKAIEKGLIDPAVPMTDEQIDNLIFAPGFSTAAAVSDLSGRGVGMDVVRRNIQALGGRIQVTSEPGRGTRMTLSLPLTLAVLDGMIIAVGAETYVLPLTNIIESLRPSRSHIHGLVQSGQMLSIRGDYVPLIYLHRLFGIPDAITDATRGLVVLSDVEGGDRVGLVIDEMLGQQQVVIKTLETNYRPIDGVSGATILGDGKVALILDVSGIARMWQEGHGPGWEEGTSGGEGRRALPAPTAQHPAEPPRTGDPATTVH